MSLGERAFRPVESRELAGGMKDFRARNSLTEWGLKRFESMRRESDAATTSFKEMHGESSMSPDAEKELADLDKEEKEAFDTFNREVDNREVEQIETGEVPMRRLRADVRRIEDPIDAAEMPTPSPEEPIEPVEEREEEVTETQEAVLEETPSSVNAHMEPEVVEAQEELLLAEDMWSDEDYRRLESDLGRRRPEKYNTAQGDYELMQDYRRLYPDKFKAYEKKESTRIYRSHDNLPRISNDPAYKRLFIPHSVGGMGFDEGVGVDVSNALTHFIRKYPEKAKAYAETDEKLKRMLERE